MELNSISNSFNTSLQPECSRCGNQGSVWNAVMPVSKDVQLHIRGCAFDAGFDSDSEMKAPAVNQHITPHIEAQSSNKVCPILNCDHKFTGTVKLTVERGNHLAESHTSEILGGKYQGNLKCEVSADCDRQFPASSRLPRSKNNERIYKHIQKMHSEHLKPA